MKKKNRKNRIIIWAIAIVLLGGIGFWKFKSGKKSVFVEIEEIKKRTILANVSESGTVQPTLEVKIAPDVSGEIVYLGFKEGDKVKKGALLLTIKPDNYKSQLQQAQASLNSAKANLAQAQAGLGQTRSKLLSDSTNYVRNLDLFEQKVISQIEIENSKLNYEVSKSNLESSKRAVEASYYQVESSKASLSQSQQNLEKTNIYSTMTGIITKLNVELGERVVGTMQMAGTEILKIADLSQMELVVEINENDIINISKGDTAKVEIDAFRNKSFQGKVTEIAYSASVSGTGSADQITNFEVKVSILPKSYASDESIMKKVSPGQSPFRPGMSGQVHIFTERQENALCVPIQSVTMRKKEDGMEDADFEPQEIIYVLENGLAKEIEVESGISDNEFIEILSGPAAGQSVIIGPYVTLTQKLKNDLPVKELTEEEKKKNSSKGK